MKPTLLLLHGALGSCVQFDALAAPLAAHYDVHVFDFRGHGAAALPDKLTIHTLTAQLDNWITEHLPHNEPVTVFGYSMGGYVALLLALEKPQLFKRITTLGTKLHWSPEIAAGELKMIDPEKIEQKVPAFAAELAARHGADKWKALLQQTAALMTDLGANNYLNTDTLKNMQVPVKLMLGDRDKMVTLDETVNACKAIPGAALSVLPETPHPLEKVDVQRLVFELV